MKTIFLLLLCFYSINSTAQKFKINTTRNTAVNTADFCIAIKEIAEIVSQDKLETLKSDSFKSVFYDPLFSTTFISKKKVPAALENFIDDRSSLTLGKFVALLKTYDDANSAKADFANVEKKIEACFGLKAKIEEVEILNAVLNYKNCELTIQTFFTSGLGKWVCIVKMEDNIFNTEYKSSIH